VNSELVIRFLRERQTDAVIAWAVGNLAASIIRRCEEAPTRDALDLVIAPLTDKSHPIYASLTDTDIQVVRNTYVKCRSTLPKGDA
jgi:hypothetical protein